MWVIFNLFSISGETILKITHFSCLIHLLKKDHRVAKLHHSKKKAYNMKKNLLKYSKYIYFYNIKSSKSIII